MEKPYCGNCKHIRFCKSEKETICCNSDSDYIGQCVDLKDWCSKWEENKEKMKYIASWSGGKDSTATIILAHENNEPLDEIVFCEVMFDKEISGELPEHIDFIKNKAIPLFESWGYKVTVLHSDKTYMDCFNHVIEKPREKMQNKGKRRGFPIMGRCEILKQCKLKALKEYWKSNKKDSIQYIGIASDEPKRLERLDETHISLLAKYNITEKDAFEICKKYDMLSPIYDFAPRGGVLVLPKCTIF